MILDGTLTDSRKALMKYLPDDTREIARLQFKSGASDLSDGSPRYEYKILTRN
jgi:hypothetical protein